MSSSTLSSISVAHPNLADANGVAPHGQTITSEPLLRVRNLCKYFPIKSKGIISRVIGKVKAVDNASFDLYPGETLGLVGESGSGKTTCARTILRALSPTSGTAHFRAKDPSAPGGHRVVDLATLPDRDLKPLRTQMQMIFQDPYSSLNPRMTVGDIISEPLLIHNIGTPAERKDKVVAILRKVGLKPEHMNRYPHAFSGGQRQRIGIARALIMRPSLVVADEAVSALDVSVQAQVINLLMDLQQEFNLTYIFVAHNLSVVRHICNRVAVMYAGRIVELAETEELFSNPRHPYTQGLMAAEPNIDPDIPMQFALAGEVADTGNLPPGCAFHPRCPKKFAPCDKQEPVLQKVAPSGCQASCHLLTPPAGS
ncbi:peptide ABC transporter ATP-binding protein [Verrucomicrobia bacterium LW23]|nr:peptide ABC transporter ATP-binding protein [Verrucomicrobia bacterium LW23]